jgi:hypothetical protein
MPDYELATEIAPGSVYNNVAGPVPVAVATAHETMFVETYDVI